MPTITITEQQAKDLAEGKDITIFTEKKEYVFRPKEGGEYWYVDSGGNVYPQLWGHYKEGDFYRLSVGNCFRTEEEAQAYREYQIALGTVRNAIKEKNEGRITVDLLPSIPFCKTGEIAQFIIDNYKDELETIRDYKF